MEQETTFYRFLSEIRAFLSKLVKNPMKADVNKYLKGRNFNKTKTINVLLKRDVLERHEKILDSTNSDEKEPKYTVKYKVRKKDFEDRIYKIYIQYFEKNLPEKKEELKECDGGDVAGATSADVCNMSAPILPLGQLQRRTVGGIPKKKKNSLSDILGKTITAESAKSPKICYITEKQFKTLIGEDVSETMSGIDDRMAQLAKEIFALAKRNSIKGINEFYISADRINNSQDYFKTNKNLKVELVYDFYDSTVATYYHKDYRMEINMEWVYKESETLVISTIVHELTHMVNFEKGRTNTLNVYRSKRIKQLDDYLYYFNPTEMQARLSQFYHYSKMNGKISPFGEMGDKILAIEQLKELLGELAISSDEVFLSLFNLLRVRHEKDEIENNDKSINILSIKNKMLNYYNQLYNNYIKKANKIFKSFSAN